MDRFFSVLLPASAIVALATLNTVVAEDMPTFQLTLQDDVFTPSELKVPSNTAFMLKVLNKEKAGAEIEAKDLKIEKVVAAGGEITMRVKPMKPGRYLLVNEYKEDKAKILGLNAARLYKIDVKAKRNALPADGLEKLKAAYLDRGGQPSNAAHGWVRAGD